MISSSVSRTFLRFVLSLSVPRDSRRALHRRCPEFGRWVARGLSERGGADIAASWSALHVPARCPVVLARPAAPTTSEAGWLEVAARQGDLACAPSREQREDRRRGSAMSEQNRNDVAMSQSGWCAWSGAKSLTRQPVESMDRRGGVPPVASFRSTRCLSTLPAEARRCFRGRALARRLGRGARNAHLRRSTEPTRRQCAPC